MKIQKLKEGQTAFNSTYLFAYFNFPKGIRFYFRIWSEQAMKEQGNGLNLHVRREIK